VLRWPFGVGAGVWHACTLTAATATVNATTATITVTKPPPPILHPPPSFIRPDVVHNFVDTSQVSPAKRLQLVHALDFRAFWTVQREVGQQYLKASLLKSALQLFESLAMWEEVIHCNVLMGHRTKVCACVRACVRACARVALRACGCVAGCFCTFSTATSSSASSRVVVLLY
jgi:hypothetical protein